MSVHFLCMYTYVCGLKNDKPAYGYGKDAMAAYFFWLKCSR